MQKIGKLVLFSMFSMGSVHPCTPIVNNPDTFYKASHLVFSGQVIKSELAGRASGGVLGGWNQPKVVTIKTENVWKGKVLSETVLHIIVSDNCGDNDPVVGSRYLFFTYRETGGEKWKSIGKNGQKIERIFLAMDLLYDREDEFLKKFRKRFGKGRSK